MDAGDEATRISAFRLFVVLSQRVRTALDRRLEPEGFTSQQALVYTAVDTLEAPRLTELADRIGMTHQNLRQLVSALERKGMLSVEADLDDGRARRVRVTEAGAAHWRARPDTGHDLVLDWFSDVSAAEVELFLDILQRVNRRLDRH